MSAELVLPRRLARATATLFGGNVAMVALQALQFVLLARLLGIEAFGLVAAINATVAIVIPLAGLGYGNLMLLRVSRDPASVGVELGNALIAVGVLGTLLVSGAALVASALTADGAIIALVATMAFNELVIVRSLVVLGQLHQALERVELTSLLNMAVAGCRVVAVLCLALAAIHEPLPWAVASCGLLLAVAIFAHGATMLYVGRPQLDFARLWSDKGAAAHFSLGTTAKAVYTELDKVVLARSAAAVELGAYTAAYRLIVMAFLPVRSLLEASASHLYRQGARSLADSHGVSRRLLRITIPYGLLVAAAIYVCAPLAVLVLGPSFEESVPMLRALAVLPLIQAVHYAFSETLTAGGLQQVRTRLQWLVAGFYGVGAVAAIPVMGWEGAVVVCLVSEALLAVLVIAAVKRRVSPAGSR